MFEMIKSKLPGILENLPLFPEQASTIAGEVDTLYLVWAALSVFFSVLIAGATVFMMLRYHRGRRGSIGVRHVHAPAVEVIAIVVPFVIAMTMFVWGAKVYVDLRQPPEDAVEYFAFGKQWMWKYQHPSGRREINNLTVPVDTPIKLTMTSEDVIHAFWLPDFRVKQDVLPGRYTTVWFEATKTGVYRLYCAEYCGSEHSLMGGRVTVLTQDDYESWLLETAQDRLTLSSAGQHLFESLACSTCHTDRDQSRGPSLHGLYGSEITLAGGLGQVVDESYIRESIIDPLVKIRAGYEPLMPTFAGQLTEEQLAQLVRYVRELPSQAGAASETSTEVAAAEGDSETVASIGGP